MSNNQPEFEVRPSTHFDSVTKKWYAATTFFVRGKEQKSAIWSDVPFDNVRRAKAFARMLADRQEYRIKQSLLETMIDAAGKLVIK
jgi:hypothetical protein